MPHKIIIDTDPGTDDAVAIFLALASPELDVLGIVAIGGNLPLAVTEQNARGLCELAGRPDIPVYAGCPRPIGPARAGAGQIHGGSGLGELVLPPASAPPQSQHGVDFLIDSLCRAEPRSITLCTLGPLTNIAVALVKSPEMAQGIAELVMMGGSSQALGNETPVAQFNIHADPQAAAIVFDSGVPITMVPLDVTHQVIATPERVERMRALGNRCGEAAAIMMPAPRHNLRRTVALHDPCVIAWLIAPELFAGAEVNVAVEMQGALTRGMTVIDWRGVSGRPVNARVLQSIDADGFFSLLAERISRLP
jgi:purine nucleosidase